MKLYDEVIREIDELLSGYTVKKLKRKPGVDWPDLGSENMIFRSDMAYELGGERYFKKSTTLLTGSRETVPEDEILLVGPDLPDIKADRPFSRITIVRVNDETMGEGDRLYTAIRKIGFSRYHVNPEGYMLRISVGQEAESVRVSKKGLEKGLNFETVGNLFIDTFRENPKVEAVKMIFITDDTFPFEDLKRCIKKAADITKAIDHIMKDVSIMDCKACSLQEICDEVEGLKEMHFKSQEHR